MICYGMDFRYLRAFMAVGQHKSFTQAGTELGIAQSAVSRQIRLLEESLATNLVLRDPHRVELTAAGQELFRRASHFVHWVDSEFSHEEREVRLGTLPGILHSWLTERLAMASELPSLCIEVGTLQSLEEGLQNGRLEMVLSTKPVDNERLTSRVLFEESYVLLSREYVDRSAASTYRWLYTSSDRQLKQVCSKQSLHFIQVNSMPALVELARRGLGVAVVPAEVAKHHPGLHVLPLPELGKDTVYLCTPNYTFPTPSFQSVFDLLTAQPSEN